MRKTYQPTINLLKPAQKALNEVLRNPIYAFTYAENIRRSVGYAPSGTMFVQPVGIKMPTEYETYTDADTHWYFIDDKNIKIMEEDMDEKWEAQKRAMGIIDDAPKEAPEVKKLNVEVDIQIKDGHILAEFGCVKHICHNLTELMVLAKKELLKEMPILKDFGKRTQEELQKMYDKSNKLRQGPIEKKPTDSQKS